MRKQFLATATVLVLAANVTTGARAIEPKASDGSAHVKNLRVAGRHQGHPDQAPLARFRDPERRHQISPDVRGGFIDLGPLGITAACGAYRSKHYCGQGYSVSGWTY